MKRRTFLTASGAVGIAGVVSGSTVVSSVFSSIHTNVLLEEFSTDSKMILDEFLNDVVLNTASLGLDEKLAKSIVMPKQVLRNNSKGKSQCIVYKNKFGDTISLSLNNGNRKVEISNSL